MKRLCAAGPASWLIVCRLPDDMNEYSRQCAEVCTQRRRELCAYAHFSSQVLSQYVVENGYAASACCTVDGRGTVGSDYGGGHTVPTAMVWAHLSSTVAEAVDDMPTSAVGSVSRQCVSPFQPHTYIICPTLCQ